MDKCPLCGLPAQNRQPEQAPVQRHRITEVERRQRQQEQRRSAAEQRRKERDERRARDAEEERRLEAEEERALLEKKRARLKKKGWTDAEINDKLAAEQAALERLTVRKELPSTRGRIPSSFLVVAILLLIASILIGGSFLLWRGGVMRVGFYEWLSGQTPTSQSADVCDGITLSTQTMQFAAAGETAALEYTLSPADCTLPVSFRTADASVATVGELGIVTAVGSGTTTLTVTCGTAEATCTVTCAFATEQEATSLNLPDGLQLSETDITFFNPNENVYLHVENVPNGTQIVWASSNEEIATVEANGHVVAVGDGTCYITATVGEYAASCIVRCNFS